MGFFCKWKHFKREGALYVIGRLLERENKQKENYYPLPIKTKIKHGN